jgi:hypothetical protein
VSRPTTGSARTRVTHTYDWTRLSDEARLPRHHPRRLPAGRRNAADCAPGPPCASPEALAHRCLTAGFGWGAGAVGPDRTQVVHGGGRSVRRFTEAACACSALMRGGRVRHHHRSGQQPPVHRFVPARGHGGGVHPRWDDGGRYVDVAGAEVERRVGRPRAGELGRYRRSDGKPPPGRLTRGLEWRGATGTRHRQQSGPGLSRGRGRPLGSVPARVFRFAGPPPVPDAGARGAGTGWWRRTCGAPALRRRRPHRSPWPTWLPPGTVCTRCSEGTSGPWWSVTTGGDHGLGDGDARPRRSGEGRRHGRAAVRVHGPGGEHLRGDVGDDALLAAPDEVHGRPAAGRRLRVHRPPLADLGRTRVPGTARGPARRQGASAGTRQPDGGPVAVPVGCRPGPLRGPRVGRRTDVRVGRRAHATHPVHARPGKRGPAGRRRDSDRPSPQHCPRAPGSRRSPGQATSPRWRNPGRSTPGSWTSSPRPGDPPGPTVRGVPPGTHPPRPARSADDPRTSPTRSRPGPPRAHSRSFTRPGPTIIPCKCHIGRIVMLASTRRGGPARGRVTPRAVAQSDDADRGNSMGLSIGRAAAAGRLRRRVVAGVPPRGILLCGKGFCPRAAPDGEMTEVRRSVIQVIFARSPGLPSSPPIDG